MRAQWLISNCILAVIFVFNGNILKLRNHMTAWMRANDFVFKISKFKLNLEIL